MKYPNDPRNLSLRLSPFFLSAVDRAKPSSHMFVALIKAVTLRFPSPPGLSAENRAIGALCIHLLDNIHGG
jgi:hypothetical protein